MSYLIPWKKWYDQEMLEMNFSADWKVEVLNMKDSPQLSDKEIATAVEKPFGTKRLAELAYGKKNAVIAIDDLTRPTNTERIIPPIVDELGKAGIKPDNIIILIAMGCHPPMNRLDLIRKLGEEIVENFSIYNHSAFYNLVSLGQSSRGTPFYIDKLFFEREVKIGVGSILPSPRAGWGGGGKIILPGVAAAETVLKHHSSIPGVLLEIDQNNFRADIEEMARRSGLDFIVNQVCNGLGQVAGIFAGDMIDAHREGIKFARQIYATPPPKQLLDVAICNSFPMDTNITQVRKALNVFRPGFTNLIQPDGSIVIVGAAPEGTSFHHLGSYQLPTWNAVWASALTRDVIAGRQLIIFSPYLRQQDLNESFFRGNGITKLCKNWAEVLLSLQSRHQGEARVGIFPSGMLQILE